MSESTANRIAFVRVSSGHFECDTNLKVVRSGRTLRPNRVVTFVSQKRTLLEEAFAGDSIGIPTMAHFSWVTPSPRAKRRGARVRSSSHRKWSAQWKRPTCSCLGDRYKPEPIRHR